jgi:hypothetical protein
MDTDMAAKIHTPTVQELIAVVEAYNAARENELRVVPVPFPVGYKNPMMDNLYDAAKNAAATLAKAVAVKPAPRQ